MRLPTSTVRSETFGAQADASSKDTNEESASMSISLKNFSFVLVAVAMCGSVCSSCYATLAVPAALDITGRYSFDDRPFDSYAFGNANYTGSIFSRVGIGNTQTDTTFANGNVTGGSNPIIDSLTHHGAGIVGDGNGFGGTASLTSTFGFAAYRADTDLDGSGDSTPVVITNNSLVQQYQLFFSLNFDHTVNAAGPDAVVRSDLDLEIDGTRTFNTELISDTFNDDANVIDGEIVGDGGGTLSRSGTHTFSVIVDPGDTTEIGIDYTLETLDIFGNNFYLAGTTTATGTYYLSLDNVVAVPEPGAFLRFGLLGLALAVGHKLRRS